MDHDDNQPTNSTANDEVDERSKAPLAVLNQVHSDLALAIALQEADVAATPANAPFFDEDEEGEEEWSDSETESEEEYADEYEFFESQGQDEEMDEEDEIDPDDMSYEDLVALGEVVGEEKRGLTAEEISAAGCLRKRKFAEVAGDVEMCVICQAEYEEKEEVVEIVGCGHAYHKECVTNWLLIRKNCPVCGYEVDPPSTVTAVTTVVGCKECGNSGDGNGGNIAGG